MKSLYNTFEGLFIELKTCMGSLVKNMLVLKCEGNLPLHGGPGGVGLTVDFTKISDFGLQSTMHPNISIEMREPLLSSPRKSLLF